MSMRKIELTKLERDGLTRHKLRVDAPSQQSDVFRLGVKWAQDNAPQSEWISCDDRMPVSHEMVVTIGVDDDGRFLRPIVAALADDGKFISGYSFSGNRVVRMLVETFATHWQPLPEPPK